MRNCALVLILAAMSGATGCRCSPTAPAAAPTSFDGTVAGGRVVFHTIDVRNADSVDVDVRWTNPDARLRVIQIDSACEPSTADTCRWLSEPGEPMPITSARVIDYYANHQGLDATGRVRVMIENLTPDIDTAYTVFMTPQHHGTDC